MKEHYKENVSVYIFYVCNIICQYVTIRLPILVLASAPKIHYRSDPYRDYFVINTSSNKSSYGDRSRVSLRRELKKETQHFKQPLWSFNLEDLLVSCVQHGDFFHFIIPFGFNIKVHTAAVILFSGSSNQINQPEIHA